MRAVLAGDSRDECGRHPCLRGPSVRSRCQNCSVSRTLATRGYVSQRAARKCISLPPPQEGCNAFLVWRCRKGIAETNFPGQARLPQSTIPEGDAQVRGHAASALWRRATWGAVMPVLTDHGWLTTTPVATFAENL